MSENLQPAGPDTAPGSAGRVASGSAGARGYLLVPALLGVLALLVAPAGATAVPGDLSSVDDQRAVELLGRSAEAARHVSYEGTQYVSAWSAVSSSSASTSAVVQVRHRAGGSTEVRVQDTQASILRGDAGTDWLAEGGGPVDLLIGAYNLHLAGTAQVAGRAAHVVEARRSGGSVAARLWLDEQTALTLRRETYSTDGQLLSASAFVDISVAPAPACCMQWQDEGESVSSPGRIEESMLHWDDIRRLRDEGFHCLEKLGDGMVLYEARQLGDVVQLSYSDGVMTVSVFEQPGQLDPAQLEGYDTREVGDGLVYTNPGPPARFIWSSGGRVVTVVADAPLETLDTILHAMPPEPPPVREDDGFLARIGRGAHKVGSWLNPFD